MTDNEIIQTLKNHIEAEDCAVCVSFGKCDEFLLTEKVLDLITRQQAEIERLKNRPYTLQIEVSKKIESQIKAKAVKAFAERLKNEIINDTAFACDSSQHTGYYDYKIKIGEIPEYIDSIVKEMVGEK